MNAKDYNKYLEQIKFANELQDKDAAKEMLKRIQVDMITNHGFNDDDVAYLIKKFRYYI